MERSKLNRLGFSVPIDVPGRSSTGMKKLAYKPEYDDPALAKKKRAAARKRTSKKKTTKK